MRNKIEITNYPKIINSLDKKTFTAIECAGVYITKTKSFRTHLYSDHYAELIKSFTESGFRVDRLTMHGSILLDSGEYS